MRTELRTFKHRTNLLVIPEDEDESKILDEMDGWILGRPLTAITRLADGYGEHYLMIQGVDRETSFGQDGRRLVSNNDGEANPVPTIGEKKFDPLDRKNMIGPSA